MSSQDKILRPERADTDASLQAERDKADQGLASQASTRTDADQVVELARERADEVLDAARQKADETLQQIDGPTAVAASLSVARAAEDAVVTEERAAADVKIETERADQEKALAILLALDREATDDLLRKERASADHAVASRDDFLAIVSHDARGLLSGLAMSAELLLRMPTEGAVGERTRAEGQRIRRFTGRMNRLIGDLLDVVSMESGKLAVVSTPQDATRLLTETMDSFHLATVEGKLRLTADLAPGPVLASFDHDRILQVLTNLVGNAIKFTPAGGDIALSLASTPNGIRFTVRDSGCGIAVEQLDSIFERFSKAAQDDRSGLGLGLYIARGIVAAHGGKIWAESAPGQGSAFHFTLPGRFAVPGG